MNKLLVLVVDTKTLSPNLDRELVVDVENFSHHRTVEQSSFASIANVFSRRSSTVPLFMMV